MIPEPRHVQKGEKVMGKKHSSRILIVRCNAIDTRPTPASFYKGEKYEFEFQSDHLKPRLVEAAIAQYRALHDIPDNIPVSTTESTMHGR